jgi:Ca2+-binding RTX toxin-like protein
MANETTTENTNQNTLQKVLAQGKQVERASVAADGTVTIQQSEAKLQSVDVADIDLLLSFSDGTYVIIPNGALDAISEIPHSVIFSDTKDSLSHLFKMVGISNPAKAGSLRVVSENIDAAKPPTEEFSTPSDEQIPETLPAPAPMVKVSAGASLGKGPGKGPGMGGSGEGEGEVAATVTPLATPQPPVYRVGKKTEVSVQDLLNGLGLGEQPNFTQTLYTSTGFKVTPSGRANLPLGAYDENLTSEQLALRASPQGQSTNELIYGTAGNDSIQHNSAFNSLDNGPTLWSKTMHLTFNNFSEVSSIEIVVDKAAIDAISGFDIQGAGVTKVSSDTWNITPSAGIFSYGQDIFIVYNVHDSTDALNFWADISVSGKTGPLNFEITNNLSFTWKNAVTVGDFTVPGDSDALRMILPSAGVGYIIDAGAGDDTVIAGAGNDTIFGGDGNDTIDGGTGNDTIDGGTGTNILRGGSGYTTPIFGSVNGGNDTVTYSQAGDDVVANLTTGHGTVGATTSDTYTSIENLIGSDHNDTLTGNDVANILYGGKGNDVLDGGYDSDMLYGGEGSDTLIGGDGNDLLDGGDNTDTASYANAPSYNNLGVIGVTIDLGKTTAQDTKVAGTDTLTGIENLIGSAYNDTFTGAHGIQANGFDGGGGTSDTVSYAPSTEGVVASLTTGLVTQTNDAASDTFINIENLTGTAFDDTLIGNNVANILTGGAGNDILEGLAGSDSFVGGAGTDIVSYAHAAADGLLGVTASLNNSTPNVGDDAIGDTYDATIENLEGSAFNDTLTGNSSNNVIYGGLGDDTLEGLDGSDTLTGGGGIDVVTYLNSDAGVNVSLVSGAVNSGGHAAGDSLTGFTKIIGSAYADTLVGDTGNNNLSGGVGNDTLTGGLGDDELTGGSDTDTVSYAGTSIGVTVNLSITTQQNTVGAGLDTLSGFENLTGSDNDDILTGDANNNVIDGGFGQDTIVGGLGVDTLSGDAGDDTITDDMIGAAILSGGADNDIIHFTAYDTTGGNSAATIDTIDGGTGNDTLISNYGGLYNGVNYSVVGASTVNLFNGIWSSYDSRTIVSSLTCPNGYTANITGGSIENYTAGDNTTVNSSASGTNVAYVYASNVDNIINGGTGTTDVVNYRYATAGVQVDLSSSGINVHGGSGNDTLSNIEVIVGSLFDDILVGNANNNTFYGSYGADIIDGKEGIDTWWTDNNITGGLSTTASLLTADQNMNIGNVIIGNIVDNNLTTTVTRIVMNGDAAGDTLSVNALDFNITNIENLTSSYGDWIFGNGVNNILYGRGLVEGFLGNDTINGPAGATASYANAGNSYLAGLGITYGAGIGVVANLTTTAFTNGGQVTNLYDAGGDTYSTNINNLYGSAFADILVGNANANYITGGAGDDVLEGLGGADKFSGGTGSNTVSYAHSNFIPGNPTAGVVVYFDTNTHAADLTGDAFGDTFVLIQNITGSNFNDFLYGNDIDNVLIGGLGDDTLNGGGGNDTASYAGAVGPVNINLATNSVTGAADTDILVSIERVIGSLYADTITGSAGDDVIYGGGGADIINGGTGGSDTISFANTASPIIVNLAGGVGTGNVHNTSENTDLTNIDNITGSAGNDSLTGDSFDNIIEGGADTGTATTGDTIDGISGNDTASYANATAGVTVSLANAAFQNTVGAGWDKLSNFDNLLGSAYNDTLTGDGSINNLNGGDGDDFLVGGLGADTLIGAGGIDTANYTSSNAGVVVTINSTSGNTGGHAAGDSLFSIENLIGSSQGDTLTGDTGNNTIEGGDGDDILDGVSGNDTVSYLHATGGVNVNFTDILSHNTISAGYDTWSNFDNIIGSSYADTLIGSVSNNSIEGLAGADTMDGGDGVDTASYASSDTGVSVTINSASGNSGGHAVGDSLSGFENLLGSTYNDNLVGDGGNNTLDGGAGDDILTGGAGADVLIGGSGSDTASYAGAAGGVTVNLGTVSPTPQNTVGAGSDILSSIENLTGSSYVDTLTGDAYANTLNGGAGNDSLTGNSGNDILDVRLGSDTAHGNADDDLFLVDANNISAPMYIYGDANNNTQIVGTGDTVKLYNLGATYSMTALAARTDTMEILDIRDGVNTTLSLTSADIRTFVDGANASQIWIKADSGETLNVSNLALSGADTSVQTIHVSTTATDYVVFSGTTQTAQIHWQTS